MHDPEMRELDVPVPSIYSPDSAENPFAYSSVEINKTIEMVEYLASRGTPFIKAALLSLLRK